MKKKNLLTKFKRLAVATCTALIAAGAACGDGNMSPSSPTLVSPGKATFFSYHDDGYDPYPPPPPPDPDPPLTVSPNSGPTAGATAVTLIGRGFLPGATVMFGDLPASDVVVVNSVTLTAITPSGVAGWVDIVVANPDGQSFTLPGGFTYADSSPATPTITITPDGTSPKAIQVAVGSRVTFVNNDAGSHDIRSDPHPIHTDCPNLNDVSFLPAGGNGQTGTFLTEQTCGFHDHNDDTNGAWRGRIVIK